MRYSECMAAAVCNEDAQRSGATVEREDLVVPCQDRFQQLCGCVILIHNQNKVTLHDSVRPRMVSNNQKLLDTWIEASSKVDAYCSQKYQEGRERGL